MVKGYYNKRSTHSNFGNVRGPFETKGLTMFASMGNISGYWPVRNMALDLLPQLPQHFLSPPIDLPIAGAISTAPAAAAFACYGTSPENTGRYYRCSTLSLITRPHLFFGLLCVPQLTRERVVAEAEAGRIQC